MNKHASQPRPVATLYTVFPPYPCVECVDMMILEPTTTAVWQHQRQERSVCVSYASVCVSVGVPKLHSCRVKAPHIFMPLSSGLAGALCFHPSFLPILAQPVTGFSQSATIHRVLSLRYRRHTTATARPTNVQVTAARNVLQPLPIQSSHPPSPSSSSSMSDISSVRTSSGSDDRSSSSSSEPSSTHVWLHTDNKGQHKASTNRAV